MIKTLAVLTATLALSSCQGTTWPQPHPALEYAATAPRKGTAVLLHGLGNTPTGWATDPLYAPLITGLSAEGWQVLVVDEPLASDPKSVLSYLETNGAASYRAEWGREFGRLIEGRPGRIAVVGVSWGGLHALLAACDNSRVTDWVVHEPVVDVSSLAEFSGIDAHEMDPRTCADHLPTHGYMSYGLADTRVGVAPSRQLALMLRAPIKTVATPETHDTTPADIAILISQLAN